MIVSIDPSTGRELERFPETSDSEVERALDEASRAFRSWRETPISQRCALVAKAGTYLVEHRRELATIIAREMGKTLREAISEIDKCALNCRHYAEMAPKYLAPERLPSDGTESYVEFPPLGCVLAVMPWNFPFWQLFRFAAPALCAGNVALLKHASNVPQCALAIERVFRESGFPQGVFRTLLIGGSKAEKLIEDPRIAAVTLTGSAEVGSKVAGAAGRSLKKAVLELGGSDPFIVLADADLEKAAETAVKARFQNAGQSCIAAKRFFVEAKVYDRFVDLFRRRVRDLVVGDPFDERSTMGPLARADLRDSLHDQVLRSVRAGAELIEGGAFVEGPGFFYAPTLLVDVSVEMPAMAEETFGPVAALAKVADVEEALLRANATEYGLGSNLWTKDLERAKRLAARIEAGSVFVNGMVASQPSLPFGGIKHSGYGRELSAFGIREFTNVQTVWVGPRRGEPAPHAE